MKKTLVLCLLTGIIMIAVPLINAYIPREAPVSKELHTEKEGKTITDSESSLEESTLSVALSYVDESFCDEGLKAVMSIAKNNCIYEAENNTHNDTTIHTEYSDEFYHRLKKLYKEIDTDLYYNGERVYIPLSELSAGYTGSSEEYPYIINVASPWDCVQENFVYDKEYEPGISAKGLDELCRNGSAFNEALRWYLPLFEIKT